MASQHTEADARVRINNELKTLGWVFESNAKNVYLEGSCKTDQQSRALGNFKPDYVLYETGSDVPLAVIEVKKPGSNLNKALDQGKNYARLIGAKIVFATDSFVTKTSTVDGENLYSGVMKVERLINESLLKKLSLTPDLEMAEGVVKDRHDLIKIFKKAQDALWGDGIDSGIDAIYEFCIVLFIKINSETLGDQKWRRLCNQATSSIMQVYKKIVGDYRNLHPGIFREIKIKKSATLRKIVDLLDSVNLIDTDIDIKGEAFEYFLSRYSKEGKSALGQYFTPRHITDMMAKFLNPVASETVYDPFCGTGGMLISCYREMLKSASTLQQMKVLQKNTLHGSDTIYGVSQIAKMNMVIIGDGSTNIKKEDSLSNPVNRQYDMAITNIPFNLKGSYDGSLYGVETNDPNTLCLMHCLQAVRKGGKAMIVVPENFCYLPSYYEGRQLVLGEGKLSAVIRLPRHVFKTYTTARTCILYFTDIAHEEKTDSFRYIDIQHDGFSRSAWREPIHSNDIIPFLENKDDLSGYPLVKLDENLMFIHDSEAAENLKIINLRDNYWFLRDVVEEKPSVILEKSKEYKMPGLSSETNTIHQLGDVRLGRNIKGDKKFMIEPGDLVIGTLHTQSGNGLFAISDDYYVGTSQLVAKIKEDIIDKDYLVAVLRKILPLLTVDDLVGRETFKKHDLLNLKIPKQPAYFSSDAYKNARQEIADLQKQHEADLHKRKSQISREVEKAFSGTR